MGYTVSQAFEFVDKIAPIIQLEAKVNGYQVCSPIIAMAICESGITSTLAKYHNYFGMKCGSSWKGKSINLKTKEEYTVGTLTTINDNFRVYDSMEEGVKGFFSFISTRRYLNLKTAMTPKQFLELIKSDGYCTSSTYVNTNLTIIAKYSLEKYDTIATVNTPKNEVKTDTIAIENYPTIRLGDKSLWTTLAQQKLVAKGYLRTGDIDGIFGQRTKQAVISFQGMNGLTKDGIIGKKSWSKLCE